MAVTSLYSGSLCPFLPLYFPTTLGAPGNGLKLFSYIAGTSTKQSTYADANLVTANANPMVIGSDGRPASPIFLGTSAGYKFILAPANDTDPPTSPIWTLDLIEDQGAMLARNFGNIQSAGSRNVASGYTILSTDRLITVNGGSSPSIINLLAASAFPSLLTIKNVGTNALAVTPNGSDVLEGAAAAYTVPAASGVTQPAITLLSNGVSAWYIVASHKTP